MTPPTTSEVNRPKAKTVDNMNQLVPITRANELPPIVTAAVKRASLRFLEFFAASIRNGHTRRAYAGAVGEFLA